MKPLIIGISLLFLFSSKVNGQINYTPFEFANYFIVSRGVYINYYEDVKERMNKAYQRNKRQAKIDKLQKIKSHWLGLS